MIGCPRSLARVSSSPVGGTLKKCTGMRRKLLVSKSWNGIHLLTPRRSSLA
eukprot:CAMPEP_0179137284 /NCGR_PEP_ID=MMETSP0796-20121207/65483_1 /TAXON_ID=73915 /ORGANISM="Pyrodinium bahamense, Strain pbaha01" /LENGTH=50 /DNA_ID=CAMNT_0020836455 /DNA_START=81 /DNA_END=229 /DNA_ORIENTATION=-